MHESWLKVHQAQLNAYSSMHSQGSEFYLKLNPRQTPGRDLNLSRKGLAITQGTTSILSSCLQKSNALLLMRAP